MDGTIQAVIEVRGSLESAICEAVMPLVREWEKENGARISDIDFDLVQIGVGPKRKFEFGFVHVDILMPNGTEISCSEIRQSIKEAVDDSEPN